MEEARPAPRIQKTYFIHCPDTDRVKIGRGYKPKKRLIELQVGCPTTLVLLGYINVDIEHQLHAEYRREHVGGEWFELTPRLRTRIDNLIATLGEDCTLPRHTLGNVDASPTFVLPPLSVGRNRDEEEWIYETNMLMAAAGRPWWDVYSGGIAIPDFFAPLVPCVTTRNAYHEYCDRYVPPQVDYVAFWTKYAPTYRSVVKGTRLDLEPAPWERKAATDAA